MTKELAIPNQKYLPAELLTDAYHPGNHEYLQSLNNLKRLIVAQTACMLPWHVTAVKRRVEGTSTKDIATYLNKKPAAVSQALAKDSARELRALLQHYNLSMDGPTDSLRRRVLWEMAMDFKDIEPNVTLKSIAELNKMNGTYTTNIKTADINIVINNEILPKGKLDQ